MIDPLKILPGYALRRASAAMLADLGGRLAPLELRPTEASILFLIACNPDITQSDIGRTLDIQRANMTPLAARLEERGLINRVPVDGRSQGLVLTAAGEALVAKLRLVIEQHEANLLSRIPEEHRPHILPALQALFEN